jgi:hypothetical protein
MSWIPFRDRLQQLPLILAGPILRHTCSELVTVWVALKEACQVRLNIYTTQDRGNAIEQLIMTGESTTVAIGENLHILAVTASGENLRSGQIYAYDLSFKKRDRTSQNLQEALTSAILPQVPISYFQHQLPTFSLPPEEIDRLKIVHGSCRKPHGKDRDALAILDSLIENAAESPDDRPHQLFLTGDQIYGDDVADPLLQSATELGNILLGWEEKLPLEYLDLTIVSTTAKQLQPGKRSQITRTQAGLTAGLHKKAKNAKSHLLSFGEYCAVYLLSWSQVFWLESFPKPTERNLTKKEAKSWRKEVDELKVFVNTLWKVRRSLANIPTYTIFDDHDVSDDWNLNQAWCLQVLGKPLGRRIVKNALLSYAFFQGWGNTPEQFEPGKSGAKLAIATEFWSASGGEDKNAAEEISRYLGLPQSEPGTGLPKMYLERDVLVLDRDREALTWHYTVKSSCHQVIVLDTRTWRGYPVDREPFAVPMLLCPSGFQKQLRESLQQQQSQQQVTFIVAPTNLFSLQGIDRIQHWHLKKNRVYDADVGDAWNINTSALAELLTILFEQRDRVIILSGDVHYSSAVRLDYWFSSNNFRLSRTLVQLTASSLNNAEFMTQLIHTKIKSSLFRESRRFWLGWLHPYKMLEVKDLQRADNESADWFCSLEWNKRQSCRQPSWGKSVPWLKSKPIHNNFVAWLSKLLQLVWQNRWLQEGKEVVGVNNIGLVRFDRFEDDDTSSSVIQDNYWYASWRKQVVFSRFQVSLKLGIRE